MKIYISYHSEAKWDGVSMYDYPILHRVVEDGKLVTREESLRQRHKRLLGKHREIVPMECISPARGLSDYMGDGAGLVLSGATWPTELFADMHVTPSTIRVTGRLATSYLYGGGWSLFGFRYKEEDIDEVRDAIDVALRSEEAHPTSRAAFSLLPMTNYMLDVRGLIAPSFPDPGRWNEINDFTTTLLSKDFVDGWLVAYNARFIFQPKLKDLEMED